MAWAIQLRNNDGGAKPRHAMVLDLQQRETEYGELLHYANPETAAADAVENQRVSSTPKSAQKWGDYQMARPKGIRESRQFRYLTSPTVSELTIEGKIEFGALSNLTVG